MHPYHLPKKRSGQAYSDSWIPKIFSCLFFRFSFSFGFNGIKRLPLQDTPDIADRARLLDTGPARSLSSTFSFLAQSFVYELRMNERTT